MKDTAGHTLAESLVVMSLIGIAGVSLVGAYRAQAPAQALEQAAWQMTMDLRRARMQAVSANVPVEATVIPSNGTYALWGDWNTNGVVDAGERTVRSIFDPFLAASVAVSSSRGRFDPSGAFESSNGYWEIRVAVTNVGSRYVRVMPCGQVDWSRETLGATP